MGAPLVVSRPTVVEEGALAPVSKPPSLRAVVSRRSFLAPQPPCSSVVSRCSFLAPQPPCSSVVEEVALQPSRNLRRGRGARSSAPCRTGCGGGRRPAPPGAAP